MALLLQLFYCEIINYKLSINAFIFINHLCIMPLLLKELTMPIALFALMLSAFAIGTTEFVIVGLIPTVA
jgi:predicted MFS family arabinose efflux permease